MTTIAISRIHYPVTTLGPGKRIGIWMQGCSIRCPGCISADTWVPRRGVVPVANVVERIEPWIGEADGVTISGGEPFEQPEALAALLSVIRERTKADILVYSGHSFETISPKVAELGGLLDALISDPYLADVPQTLALRGSDNQRLHCLTSLGEARFGPYRDAQSDKSALDVMFDDDGAVWLAGVPRRGDWERLQRRLEQSSVVVRTSTDASMGKASGA